MRLDIIAVGKIKEKYFTDAVAEYQKRLSRFAKTEIIQIPDEKIPDNASEKVFEQIKEREGQKILSAIKGGTVIAMCIEGKPTSSEALSGILADAAMKDGRITFLIGGSLGLSDMVKNRADLRISFGPITLPHQLMRVVLTEQLYRGYKIIHHERYHK